MAKTARRTFQISVVEDVSHLDGGKMWRWECEGCEGKVRQSSVLTVDDARIENEFIRSFTDIGTQRLNEVVGARFKFLRS